MKDGRTHLAYKAEHVVDLETEAILSAEIFAADQSDSATLTTSLDKAQQHVDATESGRLIRKVAADKGYHAAETLRACQEWGLLGVTTYIPEPAGRRKWTDKSDDVKLAVLGNRTRSRRQYGKRLQRLRSERVERSFAHVCDTGGGRRSWLRGIENVRKRHLMAAAAHNLALILRKLLGAGKPRAYTATSRCSKPCRTPNLSSGRCYAQWRAANYPQRRAMLAPLHNFEGNRKSQFSTGC
jgi:transposase